MGETKKPATKTAKKAATSSGASDGFSKAERDAIKERARELKNEAKAGKAAEKAAEAAAAVVEVIEGMTGDDHTLAKKLHDIVLKVAPELAPRLWYGMPAYAKDGKVIFFFQEATKFTTRYATIGFSEDAQLDDGTLWPTAYALTKLDAANEKAVTALITRAIA